MAQIDETTSRPGKRSRHNLKVDLTPMVDFGFLLITFFILTTSMTQPHITKLIHPKDSTQTTPIPENAVLTLVLGDNHSIEYFEGKVQSNPIYVHTNYSEIRSVIQAKQKKVKILSKGKFTTTLMIVPSIGSTYNDFMRIIDEIQINGITSYYVVDR